MKLSVWKKNHIKGNLFQKISFSKKNKIRSIKNLVKNSILYFSPINFELYIKKFRTNISTFFFKKKSK